MDKKSATLSIFFVSLLMCLCFTLMGIFSAFFTPHALNLSTATISSSPFNIYFVSCNKSQVEKEAIELGKDLMLNGYSGYAWQKDNYFYVLTSGYQNENDATLVKNVVIAKGGNAEIISIPFDSIKLSYSFSQEERNVMSSILKSFKDIYASLYDISICLDTGVYNETSAILEINKLLSSITGLQKNYQSLFSTSQEEIIKIIGEYFSDAHESLSMLSNKDFITPTQTLSSLIKYKYCEILHIYQNLLIELK